MASLVRLDCYWSVSRAVMEEPRSLRFSAKAGVYLLIFVVDADSDATESSYWDYLLGKF